MAVCIGTSKEEAFQNRALRNSLVNSKELEELYTTFKLEDYNLTKGIRTHQICHK